MIALDSDFIIDLLRGKEDSIKKYHEIKNEKLVTTRINFFETLFGVYIKKESKDKEEKTHYGS